MMKSGVVCRGTYAKRKYQMHFDNPSLSTCGCHHKQIYLQVIVVFLCPRTYINYKVNYKKLSYLMNLLKITLVMGPAMRYHDLCVTNYAGSSEGFWHRPHRDE